MEFEKDAMEIDIATLTKMNPSNKTSWSNYKILYKCHNIFVETEATKPCKITKRANFLIFVITDIASLYSQTDLRIPAQMR